MLRGVSATGGGNSDDDWGGDGGGGNDWDDGAMGDDELPDDGLRRVGKLTISYARASKQVRGSRILSTDLLPVHIIAVSTPEPWQRSIKNRFPYQYKEDKPSALD